MSLHKLHREQLVARPLDEVFEFFSSAGNLALLTPSAMRFEMITPEPIEMATGTLLEYRLRVHGVPIRWISRIEEWEHGRRFVDRQLKGPYKIWLHTHEFEATPGGTKVSDSVRYELPLGVLGELGGLPLVRRDLARIFDYRRDAVQKLLG
ncbi:MAG: SRPBCC family protein [Solirubrobacteraceae bacterium]|jgi:ligand-binding SRPBCC domain-containing protein